MQVVVSHSGLTASSHGLDWFNIRASIDQVKPLPGGPGFAIGATLIADGLGVVVFPAGWTCHLHVDRRPSFYYMALRVRLAGVGAMTRLVAFYIHGSRPVRERVYSSLATANLVTRK